MWSQTESTLYTRKCPYDLKSYTFYILRKKFLNIRDFISFLSSNHSLKDQQKPGSKLTLPALSSHSYMNQHTWHIHTEWPRIHENTHSSIFNASSFLKKYWQSSHSDSLCSCLPPTSLHPHLPSPAPVCLWSPSFPCFAAWQSGAGAERCRNDHTVFVTNVCFMSGACHQCVGGCGCVGGIKLRWRFQFHQNSQTETGWVLSWL